MLYHVYNFNLSDWRRLQKFDRRTTLKKETFEDKGESNRERYHVSQFLNTINNMSKRIASSQLNKDAYERNRSSDSDSQEKLQDEDIIVLRL